MYTFINIIKFLWKPTYFVMLIYRGHEQLKPIYDNVSGTSKIIAIWSPNIIYVFSNIANCFWKGVLIYPYPVQGLCLDLPLCLYLNYLLPLSNSGLVVCPSEGVVFSCLPARPSESQALFGLCDWNVDLMFSASIPRLGCSALMCT